MKPKVTGKDAILCATQTEFDRMLKIFELDPEYMDWSFYKERTVLYPLKNQYGDLNGNALERSLNIVKSESL